MIIVSGKIYVSPGQREVFLQSSHQAMTEARLAPGCRDFIVAADPIEHDRVNVYEEWGSEVELKTFRGSGPNAGLTHLIVRAIVSLHKVTSAGTL